MDAPRETEMATVDCKCDHCGCSLNNRKTVWVWNEHLACSRDHAQRAQANTNAIESAKAFKRTGLGALNYGVNDERLQAEIEKQKTRDLL